MFSYAAALLYLSRENHPEPLPLGQQENFFKTSIIADSLPTWNINPRFLFFPLLLSSLFVFGIEGGKKERKGMKKGYRYTVFKYNFPGRYGGRGLAQSTIRYSYVGGIHTACPNSAASFCGKIRAFRDRLNNNRPGLKRSNSSPGDIAVQKIYTEYVFLHHDPPFFLFSFFFDVAPEPANYRAANREIFAFLRVDNASVGGGSHSRRNNTLHSKRKRISVLFFSLYHIPRDFISKGKRRDVCVSCRRREKA